MNSPKAQNGESSKKKPAKSSASNTKLLKSLTGSNEGSSIKLKNVGDIVMAAHRDELPPLVRAEIERAATVANADKSYNYCEMTKIKIAEASEYMTHDRALHHMLNSKKFEQTLVDIFNR